MTNPKDNSLRCRIFGHKFKITREEHIVFEVVDFYFKCERCSKGKTITHRYGLVDGWFPYWGSKFYEY